MRIQKWLTGLACMVLLGCSGGTATPSGDVQEADTTNGNDTQSEITTPPPSSVLEEYCEEQVGPPSIDEVAPNLFVARGFDLANTIILHTTEGNVVIDPSMSPERAQTIKDALPEEIIAPTAVIFLTHSHLDHIGGASVWAEEGTEIWATDAFFPHLMKQYGSFRDGELKRATLQHAHHLTNEELPCSAVGKRVDLTAALTTGIRKPTHTFSGTTELVVGGVTLELVEAHGETHDQLFIYIAALDALMCGDNYYAAFPNLYTIRGTSTRPVEKWVQSLDMMRRRDPAILIPSHTKPLTNRDEIRETLRDYRDGIQWIYDAVVRGANALDDIDQMAKNIQLPAHLAAKPYLRELYGQVDWSTRGIYGSQVGWFDGRADRLYRPDEVEAREVEMMGGADAVLAAAKTAQADGELRWAVHLLGKLRDSGLAEPTALDPVLASAYRELAYTLDNTNGRAYLLESALLLDATPEPPGSAVVDDAFLQTLPMNVFFDVLGPRLKVAMATDVHESMAFDFSDTGLRYVITVRNGVAEVVEGEPLPGTPEPIATLTTTESTWRRLAVGALDQITAVTEGLLEADNLGGVITFMGRFEQGY